MPEHHSECSRTIARAFLDHETPSCFPEVFADAQGMDGQSCHCRIIFEHRSVRASLLPGRLPSWGTLRTEGPWARAFPCHAAQKPPTK